MTEHRRTLRIAAEYMCFPTWVVAEHGGLENPDPADVGLPDDVAADLMAWSDEYDAIYPEDDPGSAAFSSAKAEASFYERGRALAQRAADVVSDRFTVVYRDRRGDGDVVVPQRAG